MKSLRKLFQLNFTNRWSNLNFISKYNSFNKYFCYKLTDTVLARDLVLERERERLVGPAAHSSLMTIPGTPKDVEDFGLGEGDLCTDL